MSDTPTLRQQSILDFITRQVEAQGMPPTLAEIASAFGFNQTRGAHKHLLALQAKGHLTLLPGKARGIRLQPSGRQRKRVDALSLPILGRVAAGLPIGADAQEDQHLLLDRGMFVTRPDYLLRVHGDSMIDDGIFDGDLIAVHRTGVATNGQIVVARIDGELTVKRFHSNAQDIRLLPRNPDYAPIMVAADADFAIEGLYCGLVRSA